MSEIPETDAKILSELLRYKWDDDYDNDDVERAIHVVFDDRPELEKFLAYQCDEYYNLADKQGYLPSWRDFRDSNINYVFKNRFDRDAIIDEIETALDERTWEEA